MSGTIAELASSGRAKCRGCERLITKGALRFGEVLENPRADGRTTTFWYHPLCAAYKRPSAMLEFLDAGEEWPQPVPSGSVESTDSIPDSEQLRRIADAGLASPRLPRLHRAGLSPSARATCRGCKELIDKAVWRISVVFFEEGYLNPAGYIHASCVQKYAETTDTALERIQQVNLDLSAEDLAELEALVAGR